MQIYVINLEERTDRWAYMSGQLDALGLNYQRISAIKGTEVDQAIMQKFGQRKGHQLISPNEMGCSLSHRLAWQHLVDRGDEWALFLEDDVQLSNDLPRFLEQWPGRGPRFDVVRIETRLEKVWMAKPHLRVADVDICPIYSNIWGAAAYMVRRRSAGKMLARKWMLRYPVDNAMFDHRIAGRTLLWVGQAMPGLGKCKSQESGNGLQPGLAFSSDLQNQRQLRFSAQAAKSEQIKLAASKLGPDGAPSQMRKRRGPLIEHTIRDFVWARILKARPTTTTFKP